MSIITEQNILGNPELATATRPGKGTIAAKYAFSNGGYEQELYEMMGNARGGTWSSPTSYSPAVDMAEATEATPAPTVGVADEPELSSAVGTEYGTQGGEALTENAEQTTALEQVAEVISDTVESTESIIPDMTNSSMTSATITEVGADGAAIASGGTYMGFESDNQYYINTNTEEITEPEVVESTGLKSVTSTDLDQSGRGGPSLGADAPSTVGGYSQGASTKTKEKTTGSSSVKKKANAGLEMHTSAALKGSDGAPAPAAGGGYTQGASTRGRGTTFGGN
jgi:hypothetical protein